MTDANISHTTSGDIEDITQRISEHEHIELKPFEYTEHNALDMEQDIDPDNNFFSSLDNNCCYYTDSQFNQNIKVDGKLSIIHFNSRSLYANFVSIKNYLSTFSQPFNIIAITETWISAERGIDFELDGYEFTYINRQNGYGGAALYIDKSFSFRIMDGMTSVVDNLLECLTIEICMEKNKNALISCIYRAPDSSIELFTEWMESMFSKISNKMMYLCGDWNIDILNPYNHNNINAFIDLMYSMSLFPKITRPSRISSHSATLIDNIFRNDIENNTMSGLLINDISDHLPVFCVFDKNYGRKVERKFEYKRVRSEESIGLLKNQLREQNWDALYVEKDVDTAYETFLKIFNSLYDKNCPIKKYHRKVNFINCPWISKGLQNACKKKNTLYREFIRQTRTKASELKYKKIYKNVLTNIIRTSKKDHYKKKLDGNKHNIKEIWKILN